MSKILAVNAGSSSLKFKLFNMPSEIVLIEGIVERIGFFSTHFSFKVNGVKFKELHSFITYEQAVNLVINTLTKYRVIEDLDEIIGIGHRVVHGGEVFKDSVIIDDKVIDTIDQLKDLAPLHNPANLIGIKQFISALPSVHNIAVFDTAFHQTLTEEAFIYGVPYEWYEQYGIRKYGFHGTSHKYVSTRVRQLLNLPKGKVIVCHLGNGSSICAVDGEVSIDTSMGFTPLDGLLMGTRCGDIDPAIIPYIMSKTNKTINEIEIELNKKSGLLGVSGFSNDSRDIEEGILNGDKRCKLAYDIFIRRITAYIASYHILLNGADAIAFTAGIGENSSYVRQEVIKRLDVLGVKLDLKANNENGMEKVISSQESTIRCLIVPTNEEVIIARDVMRLMNMI